MTIKTALSVIALALVPALASAQCAGDKHVKITASACGEGMVWDTAAQACVVKPTS